MMIQDCDNSLPGGCRLIPLAERCDERGCLSFAEVRHDIPFEVERVFWIYDVSEGQERGAHSHNECAEVVVPVCGSFDMMVDDGRTQAVVHMDSPHVGILIPPGVWCCLRNFSEGTVCVVMASHPYNAAGYTHDYEEYKCQIVDVRRYEPSMYDVWNDFVAQSKNGTFLFDRRYMDYHADRFEDCSLMCYKGDVLLAVLPANWVEETRTVVSHGGLTYGGLLLSEKITTVEAMQVMSGVMEWMRKEVGACCWLYKCVPHIYHRLPSEEDLYALFRQNAVLKARAVSSVIDNRCRIPMREVRRRGVGKACKHGVNFHEAHDLAAFWKVLETVLEERHGCVPVHSLDEMKRLKSAFPEQIRLYVAADDEEVLAGVVVYEAGPVAHAQYIAASDKGRAVGALDGLFAYLIEEVYATKPYFDFGISTEQGGSYLNEGLLFQKEGFGARAVVYDWYQVDL